MTDTSEHLSKIELPSGLPEGQWQIHPKYDSAIAISRSEGFRIIAHVERFDPPEQWKAVARAIASIPAMAAEIAEFRKLKEYAKSLGQQTYLEIHADNESLHAQNAKLREAFRKHGAHLSTCALVNLPGEDCDCGLRTILAKTEAAS